MIVVLFRDESRQRIGILVNMTVVIVVVRELIEKNLLLENIEPLLESLFKFVDLFGDFCDRTIGQFVNKLLEMSHSFQDVFSGQGRLGV